MSKAFGVMMFIRFRNTLLCQFGKRTMKPIELLRRFTGFWWLQKPTDYSCFGVIGIVKFTTCQNRLLH